MRAGKGREGGGEGGGGEAVSGAARDGPCLLSDRMPPTYEANKKVATMRRIGGRDDRARRVVGIRYAARNDSTISPAVKAAITSDGTKSGTSLKLDMTEELGWAGCRTAQE